MNAEQERRLRVASEQMAAMTMEPISPESLSTCTLVCREHGYKGGNIEDRVAFAAVKLTDALIAEIERTTMATLEKHPGWVFVDRYGRAWGFDADDPGVPFHVESRATRPFATCEDATKQAEKYGRGFAEVRPWRPTDRVPPMPEGK